MMKTDILGVRFDSVTRAEAVGRLVGYLEDEGFARMVVTPNPEMVMAAVHNSQFRDILNLASLVVPDGIGVIIASRILGGKLSQRVAGIELVEALFTRLSEEGRSCSVYLLGGKPGVAERAAEQLQSRYAAVRIAGVRDGYFSEEYEKLIAEDIGRASPDVLLVGLGFPKQEIFIDRYRAVLNAKVSIGCGGSLDVFAGEVERAPVVFRRLGLEWLYRILRQPARWRRIGALPLFVLYVIKKRLMRA
ncbi:MAG: WecB/TagA/CpsF family glycosyltransferase [Defluviitaleaceae bacterium]|nr:WecB/TagA/CpsF family glycosyltransferase [Defluviitaleaceae bacterium]